MNLRNTYILFAAVVAVLIIFAVVLMFGPRGEADDYLFPALRGKGKSDEVAEIKKSVERVEIERMNPPNVPLLFEKEGTRWVMKKPYPARIESSLIDRLVDSLIDAKIDRKAPPANKAAAGLEAPSAAVTLTREGKSYRVLFGQMGLGSGGKVFAATGEEPDKVLTLRRSAIDELLKPGSESASTVGEAVRSVSDFRPSGLLADGSPIPWDVAQRITIKKGEREIALKRDDSGNWLFTKPDDYGLADLEGDPTTPATQTIAGVKPLLTRIASLRAAPGDHIEGVKEFGQYGLEPGQESLRLELGRTDGATEALLIGKKADEQGTKVYARLEGEQFVVKVDAKTLEQIQSVLDSPKVLRDRNLTNLLPSAFDAIDITISGEKPIELRRVGNPPRWRIFEGTDAYEDANPAAVSELLNKLTERRNIKDFPEGDNKALGLDPPTVSIDLWNDGIVKKDDNADKVTRPELKGDPALRLTFGKKDKDIVYVRRAQGVLSNVVALPESTLTLATRTLTAYLDLTLPSFDRLKVTKLTFNRGETKYIVEKPGGDPNAAGWKITQPADLAERTADAELINQALTALSTLQATRVIAHKATEDELARFGLKTPHIEATVELKDVKEPKVYQFGAESADDKQQLYSRQAGSDRVYLVNKSQITPLSTGEVVDPTIWRVEEAKITGVKLTGWQDLTGGKPLTLDLVRKSPTEWSVKDQPDYTVDATKAEALATALVLVRTDKFVRHKGGPAPEHKLDVQTGALQVELTVTGEKEPLILTVGGETKENDTEYYFASSNKAPGAVFLVFKERFAEIKKNGRGYFQKK